MNKSSHNIKECRDNILQKLTGIYPAEEIKSLTSVILMHLTGLSYPSILARSEMDVSQKTWDKINEICDLLKKFTPIQYILGETEFMGHSFKIIPGILIPRPETEELVDLVIKENPAPGLKIIDIGTGSGIIAIALCLGMITPFITATDINPLAIEAARNNNNLLGAGVEFRVEDILQPLADHPEYDIIVSNPPYVREAEKSYMSPNVLNFEPHNALFVPDDDPLIFFKAIFTFAESHLSKGGMVYCEINESLGDQMVALADKSGFSQVRIIRDINGKDRIMACRNHE